MKSHFHLSLSILFAFVFGIVSAPRALAQAVRVNIDRKTVQAMSVAFAAEALVEDMYLKQNSTILENYTQAEVAAAVIFASKMLNRKALTTLGVWTDPTENYYYRRIYNLVGRKLMPKIWTVSSLMLRRPGQALYWGSYLCKICAEIQNLCYQFESVVTNSVLSFSDIAFLSISPELKQLFDPRQLGGIDWAQAVDSLFEFIGEYSKETFLGDIDALYQKVSAITSITASTITDELLSASSFKDYASQGLFELIQVIDHYFQVYESLEHEITQILKTKIGPTVNPSSLFTLAAYNLQDWLSDYLASSETMRYTQRWSIVRSAAEEEEMVYQYFPPLDNNSIKSSSEWYRITTTNPSYQPSQRELDRIRENTERYSEYSQTKINELNRNPSQPSSPGGSSDPYRYSIHYQLYNYSLYDEGNHTAKAYAYAITVKRRANFDEVVYSSVFDSGRESIDSFKAQMQSRLESLQRSNPESTFQLRYNDPNYYTPTDQQKIHGVETVVISSACSDKVELSSGVTQYKCRECGSSVNSHTRQCAMATSLSSSSSPGTGSEQTQLQSMIDDYQSQILETGQHLAELKAEENEILQQLENTDPTDTEEIKRLQDLKSENTSAQQQTTYRIKELKRRLNEVTDALDELEQDNKEEDEYNRIPSIMQQLSGAFSLQWNTDGHWSGNTFIVTGKCSSLKRDVTLRVNISIARGPKYFMGIKIHRAIVKLDWTLTGAYSDSQIVDIVELDATTPDADKARIVNEHIAQASEDFAGCSIITEYVQSETVEADNTDDSYHLLWASDRLDIARMVETRLTNIYANLVSMEKFMNYNLRIVDVIRAIAPTAYDAYQRSERTQRICTESLQRWRDAANPQNRNADPE